MAIYLKNVYWLANSICKKHVKMELVVQKNQFSLTILCFKWQKIELETIVNMFVFIINFVFS